MTGSGSEPRPAQDAAPTAADFDGGFANAADSAGLRRVWQAVDPSLPVEVEPFSFVSTALLRQLAAAVALAPGQRLVDLACGRGGPGLWLARHTGASLVGVDFSAVAIEQAQRRAALFGLAERARFTVGELAATGLPDGCAEAVVCVDAMHFAEDLAAAAGEVFRILRPGGRLALTNWQARAPGDRRIRSGRRNIDWARILDQAGFSEVQTDTRPEWHNVYTGIYRAALDQGEPGDDRALAALQDEARRNLPNADLQLRVVVTAIRATSSGGCAIR